MPLPGRVSSIFIRFKLGNYILCVLDTTRNPRPGEVDGKGQLTNRQLD